MATIENFRTWFERDLGDAIHYRVEMVEDSGGPLDLTPNPESPVVLQDRRQVIRIFTHTNAYSITAVESVDGSTYLGCVSKSRKERAGENWHRGNDLPDGEMTEETWRQILCRIVSYELQQVQHNRMTADWTGEVPEPDTSRDAPEEGPAR